MDDTTNVRHQPKMMATFHFAAKADCIMDERNGSRAANVFMTLQMVEGVWCGTCRLDGHHNIMTRHPPSIVAHECWAAKHAEIYIAIRSDGMEALHTTGIRLAASTMNK
jgi:hypothetical protein